VLVNEKREGDAFLIRSTAGRKELSTFHLMALPGEVIAWSMFCACASLVSSKFD